MYLKSRDVINSDVKVSRETCIAVIVYPNYIDLIIDLEYIKYLTENDFKLYLINDPSKLLIHVLNIHRLSSLAIFLFDMLKQI